MNKRLAALSIVVAAAAGAGLSAAVAVPVASARSAVPVKLSLLPLPKSLLGSAAQRLRLEHHSGGYTKPRVLGSPLMPNRATRIALPDFAKLRGYALDYGLGASGGAGVTEVRTSVDQYKTSAAAKRGLALWKRLEGLATEEQVAPVGSGRFAVLVHYSAANIAPLFGFDEQFTQGRYEADVTVWAGQQTTAETLAPKLARKLEARIKLAIAGRLHAKPVRLPARQKLGPPPGGPDLAPLALKPADLGMQTVRHWYHGYDPDWNWFELSHYQDELAGTLAGPKQSRRVGQDIEWFATANQASFMADVAAASFGNWTPVDLSSIGDGARGALAPYSTDAQLVFSSGHLLETVFVFSSSALSTQDVQALAQTVANKINSAGLGSKGSRDNGKERNLR